MNSRGEANLIGPRHLGARRHRPPPLGAGFYASALQAALEFVPQAAIVGERRHGVLAANARAGPAPARELLDRALESGAPEPWKALPLAEEGVLLVAEAPLEKRALVHSLATRWRLTQRQRAVLERLADGCGNEEIARQLGCARNTVELHVGTLLARFRVQSRTELLALLLDEALRR